MELRPWLLWVVAAGALVLLAADARAQKVYTNTWAVHVPGGPAVADSLARKHGFLNLGQVGAPTAGWPRRGSWPGVGSARAGVRAPGPGLWAYLLRAIWVGGMFWVALGGWEPWLVPPLGFQQRLFRGADSAREGASLSVPCTPWPGPGQGADAPPPPGVVRLPLQPAVHPRPLPPGDCQMESPAQAPCSVADLRGLLPLLASSGDKAVPVASPPATQPAAEGASSECGPSPSGCHPSLAALWSRLSPPAPRPTPTPAPLTPAGAVAGAAGGKAKDQTRCVPGAHGPQVSPAVVPGTLPPRVVGTPPRRHPSGH